MIVNSLKDLEYKHHDPKNILIGTVFLVDIKNRSFKIDRCISKPVEGSEYEVDPFLDYQFDWGENHAMPNIGDRICARGVQINPYHFNKAWFYSVN